MFALNSHPNSKLRLEPLQNLRQPRPPRLYTLHCRPDNKTAAAHLCIRQCRSEDIDALCTVYAEAFARGNFPDLEDNEFINDLEESYAVAIKTGMQTKLVEALHRKRQAQLLHREYRLLQEIERLKRSALVQTDTSVVTPATAPSRRQLDQWRKQRMFCVLLAVPRDPTTREPTGQPVGCMTLCLMRPEALLPPPWPSMAPTRLYLSNMAVLPSARRQGVASSLLAAGEVLARRWGQDSLWLHVSCLNDNAKQLYAKAGYTQVNAGFPLAGPFRQELMMRRVNPDSLGRVFGAAVTGNDRAGARALTVAGSTRREDGVFMWGVEPVEQEVQGVKS